MIAKEEKKVQATDSGIDRFTAKARLNLNDLLKKRSEEKKVDKKTNFIILFSATTLAIVVLLILNL